jgi:hypothetical protein
LNTSTLTTEAWLCNDARPGLHLIAFYKSLGYAPGRKSFFKHAHPPYTNGHNTKTQARHANPFPSLHFPASYDPSHPTPPTTSQPTQTSTSPQDAILTNSGHPSIVLMAGQSAFIARTASSGPPCE